MNIDTETIQREANTILAAPAAYKLMIIRHLRNDSRFASWDDESLAELERRAQGEKEKMQIIPLNTKRDLIVPSQELVTLQTDSLDYNGPLLSAGKGNEILYRWSWKTQKGQNPPTLRDLQEEVQRLNYGMDWRTTHKYNWEFEFNRDLEGYYVRLMPKAKGMSAWIENGKEILRAGEKLYFTEKGIKKFFHQCVPGGTRELKRLEELYRRNRACWSQTNDPEYKARYDQELEIAFKFMSMTHSFNSNYGFNSGVQNELITFIGKNAHTGLVRRYIGGVYKRYNQLTDDAYIEALIRSNPELLAMPIIEATVSSNMTRIQMLDESPEVARQIIESGFQLHTPYKSINGGNSQNSTCSAFLAGGNWTPDCWNGQFRFAPSGATIRCRKNSSYESIVSRLSGGVTSIRLESQGIKEMWQEAQNQQVSNFATFLDSMVASYRPSGGSSEEDDDGTKSSVISQRDVEYMKECISEETNAGRMYTAGTVGGEPEAACSVQRVVDAVTYSANRITDESRLLTACYVQDFAVDIMERAAKKQREYVYADASNEQRWSGFLDVEPETLA